MERGGGGGEGGFIEGAKAEGAQPNGGRGGGGLRVGAKEDAKVAQRIGSKASCRYVAGRGAECCGGSSEGDS